VLDRLLPGRTCKRDLIQELADAPAVKAKHLYSDRQIIDFVRACNQHMAPMTFNVGIYQYGTMAAASVEQLHRLNAALGRPSQ
jgi:hypothetical protein